MCPLGKKSPKDRHTYTENIKKTKNKACSALLVLSLPLPLLFLSKPNQPTRRGEARCCQPPYPALLGKHHRCVYIQYLQRVPQIGRSRLDRECSREPASPRKQQAGPNRRHTDYAQLRSHCCSWQVLLLALPAVSCQERESLMSHIDRPPCHALAMLCNGSSCPWLPSPSSYVHPPSPSLQSSLPPSAAVRKCNRFCRTTPNNRPSHHTGRTLSSPADSDQAMIKAARPSS